jgi:hypothetical protein
MMTPFKRMEGFFLLKQGCMGFRGFGGSSKVSLGVDIPYQLVSYERPTPGQPNGRLGVGHPQGQFNLLVTKKGIHHGQPTAGWGLRFSHLDGS